MTVQIDKHDPTDPYGQERERIKTARKRLRERNREDLLSILATPQGRRFIWRLFAETRVFAHSFTGQALETAFREGQRDIGLSLYKQIKAANPEAFIQLEAEAASDDLIKATKQQEEEVNE